jgi:hypothetical protein
MSRSNQFDRNPSRVEGFPTPTDYGYFPQVYVPEVPPSRFECPSCGMRSAVPVESNLLTVGYHVPNKDPYKIHFRACANCLMATVARLCILM